MRGEKEIDALFKPKRGRKNVEEIAESEDEGAEDEDEVDEPDEEAALEMVLGLQGSEWQALEESSSEDDDAGQNDLPLKGVLRGKHASFRKPSREGREVEVEVVIEDSDWGDAEIIT
jgi:structure-specific endonuclease subunit SLX1